MLAVWGGPTPHYLVILCLCYANQTSSEIPILSSNRDTARLGRGDRILLPSVIPAQVQGHHNTMRSTLTIEFPFRRQCCQTHRRITLGIPPFLAVAPVDRTQQGIWGWPMQSPGQLQMLILSQKPRRKQKKRAGSALSCTGVALTLCTTLYALFGMLLRGSKTVEKCDFKNSKFQSFSLLLPFILLKCL